MASKASKKKLTTAEAIAITKKFAVAIAPAVPVIAVEKSENSKIGLMSATYATQATCPDSCKLRGAGCYAESSFVGMHTKKLNAAAAAGDYTVDDLARMEAAAIGALSGNLPLRMHVVGDATTKAAASILAAAARDYSAKHVQSVYSYTHGWRAVPAAAWRGVSVLASCETARDVRAARKRGYATALVVAEHPAGNKLYSIGEGTNKINVVPCPNQHNAAMTCAQCKLCLNSEFLKWRNLTIGFELHGSGAKQAAAALGLVTIQGMRTVS